MNVKETVLVKNIEWPKLALVLGLIALGIAIPQMGLPQAITGTLVNALLIATVETAGIGAAVLVGLSTPLNALAGGVLPPPLMVMIPFIGIANAVLSTVYGAFKAKNRLLALLVGATLKFAWLYGVTAWLTANPLKVVVGGAAQPVPLPASLVAMMQWPQLATALAGGLIVVGAVQLLKRD